MGQEFLKKLHFLTNANIKELNAKGAFDLFQSYGFPIEMTTEICKEKGFTGFKRIYDYSKTPRTIQSGAEQNLKVD